VVAPAFDFFRHSDKFTQFLGIRKFPVMSFDLISTVLFGQSWLESSEVMTLLKLFIAIPLPIFLGTWLAKKLRLPDLGWKLSLIFFSLAMGGVFLVSYPLKLGVDLKGGVILVYEIDREARQAQDPTGGGSDNINWGQLLQRLNERIKALEESKP